MSEAPNHIPAERRRYEAVVDSLLELIELKELRPGDAFPTERDLADEYGVSRSVLRQAFGVLEDRGLIRTRRGSGRYLREAAGEQQGEDARSRMEVASIADVLEARVLLESRIAALACDRRTAEEARRLDDTAHQLNDWADNVRFHAMLASCTHNFMLEKLVRDQLELSSELHQRDHYKDPDRIQKMKNEHCAIAAAVIARDAETAERLLSEHLKGTSRLLYQANQE